MKVGVIGVGNMGSAILEKLAENPALSLFAVEKDRKKLSMFLNSPNISEATVEELKEKADMVIVAVKPQDVEEVFKALRGFKGILVSVVAGLSTNKMREITGVEKLVRLMPNLALKVGKGIAAASFQGLSEAEKERILTVLSIFGEIVEIDERLFPAATATIGSGPAFVFVLVEAFLDACVRMGIPFEKAREIVCGVFEGSIALLKGTGEHPAVWKHRITSPAGTTIEGLAVLERSGARGSLIDALYASYLKAKELER